MGLPSDWELADGHNPYAFGDYPYESSFRNVYDGWENYARALEYFEPLLTETVLFGKNSNQSISVVPTPPIPGVTGALFGCMLYASLPLAP